MNELQRKAYEHPLAVANGALPESLMVQRTLGRFGYTVGLSLNK
jgi:hypothetical protein